MLNGKSEYYCIKGELEICFNVLERGAASEMVKWKTGLIVEVFTAVLEI
jgi:hypothetical protein